MIVRVLQESGPQRLRARIERVLSAGRAIAPDSGASEIDFVRSPGHMGDMTLDVGDRALVFMTRIGGQLYEAPWRGHMVLEDIDGRTYAIFQTRELWCSAEVPIAIRDHSRPDPKRPYASAIRWDVLEAYLGGLIERRPQ